VPTLVDGERVLWESSAIMAYLCIKQGSDMWPTRDPDEQVEVLRWISWNDCHWAPAVAPFYFEHIVKSTFGIGSPDVESLKPKVANLRKFAEVLEGPFEWTQAGRVWKIDNRRLSACFDGHRLA
jgi:glutathione S-transferase